MIAWISKKKMRVILAPGNCRWYSVLIGASNVAIVPAIGGYGVEDIYLGEFSPQVVPPRGRRKKDCAGPGH